METSARPSRIKCLSMFLPLILFFSLNESAGYASNPEPTKTLEAENQWEFHSEEKGVKIYYQISSCNNRGVVYLKFDNTNKETVKISWKESFYTKQIPEEKESYTGRKELELIPGETYQSECDQIKVKECITFTDQALPTYKADIIRIKLKNITVTKA